MTSPSQLKYLDAIGIPVWISRDLIVDKIKKPEEGMKADNFVDNILHDLDEIKSLEPSVALKTPQSSPQKIPSHPLSYTPISDKIKGGNEIASTSLHKIYACGDPQADWLVIGESPEFISNLQNQPFADSSGVLLSNMLQAIGIKKPRESAYLLNTIKLSLQIVAEQEQQNAEALKAILLSVIDRIKPKIILVVGQMAAQRLLNSKEPLARLRGKKHYLPNTQIPLIVTYYPSYLLNKPLDKRKAWEDLQLAMSLLNK